MNSVYLKSVKMGVERVAQQNVGILVFNSGNLWSFDKGIHYQPPKMDDVRSYQQQGFLFKQ